MEALTPEPPRDGFQPDAAEALGRELRRLRLAAGLSQPRLAKLLDLGNSRGQISGWETGAVTPGPEILRRYANHFGVEEQRLLDLRVDRLEARDEEANAEPPTEAEHDRSHRFPTARVVVAVLVIAVVVGVVITAVLLINPGGNSGPSPGSLPSASFSSPTEDERVGWPTAPIHGTLTRLGGYHLWLIQHKVGEDGVHPFNQACATTASTWNCDVGYLGEQTGERGVRFVLDLVATDVQANAKLVAFGHRNKNSPDAYRPIRLPAGAHPVAQITVIRR